jgi:hypothetical protein
MTLRPAALDQPHLRILSAHGTLNGATYLAVRDGILKAAVDQPRAVVIDVTALTVEPPSAWAVFTAARWLVSVWPDVPIMLVCAHQPGRDAITRNGVARYVPVYPDVAAAVASTMDTATHDNPPNRRHARTSLHRGEDVRADARRFTADTLTAWRCGDLVPVAATVAWVLVDNVLAHTDSAPVIKVEEVAGTVTVAVTDRSTDAAVRHERPTGGTDVVSGLAIVSALTRRWGSLPTGTGKTVWAVIGPENRL